jgi:hypothetical protein
MTKRRILAGTALLVIAAGCGARSSLDACRRDADCDDGIECTHDACGKDGCIFTPDDTLCGDDAPCTIDVCTLDGCAFVPDHTQCDDGVDCTDDSCEPDGCLFEPNEFHCEDGIQCTVDACTPQGCTFEPDDGLCYETPSCEVLACDPGAGCVVISEPTPCDDGIECTFDGCDAAGQCYHEPCDSLCNDADFCDGVERCDADAGCVAGPPACQLGLACSADTCSDPDQQCQHSAPAGCAPPVRLLVGDGGGALLSVSPYGGPAETIAPPDAKIHFDVAILGERWFALDTNPPALVELLPETQVVIASFSVPSTNSLGAGPDGQLYAAEYSVFRIDPDSGFYSSVADLPPGYVSSGDIAFLGDRMFVSTSSPCGQTLVEVDTATGSATPHHGNGLDCVFGLAVSGDTMFVLDCNGKIGTYDPDTGETQVLSTPGISVYGADTLP